MFLAFLQSTLGEGLLVALTLLTLGGLFAWAHGHSERVLIVGTAAILTVVVGAIYVLALAAGWWAGDFFATPALVQAGLLIPFSSAGWTLWLAGYRWLTDRTGQALQVYVAISLLLVLAVAVAHRLNLGRGKILVGPDWTILYEAIIAEIVAWVPVLVFEWLRRTLERSEFVP